MGYNYKDLNWKYRWTQNSVSLVWHTSSEIWPCLPLRLIYCHFPHRPPSMSPSWPWMFLPLQGKRPFLYTGGVLLRNLVHIHLPFRSSFRGIPPLSFLLPHLNSLALLFSFERLLSAPEPLLRLWLSSPHAPHWTSLIFMFLALTHSWPPNTIG